MKHREPNPATLLAAVLATENGGPDLGGMPPYRAARDAETLVRLGRKAQRIAVDQCNRPWTDADYERAEKARAKIAKDAGAILAEYGATVANVHCDPRGCGMTFKLASGSRNGFGDEWSV